VRIQRAFWEGYWQLAEGPMFDRYDTEPYRFIPPFRGKFWCRVAGRVIPRHLRSKKMKVMHWQFEGLERLRESVDRQAGILLTPNHSRWADPMVMGMVGTSIKQYLYYVASYHLFKQSRFMGWVMNRIGGYSIWREGSDRESLKTSARILAEAERPVVLFPEGTWFRQNDRVGVLQDGLSLILRQAAKQSDRPLVIHPVGLKYWMLEDPRPELERRLEKLERRLGWHAQRQLPLVERIEKVGGALLALKEIEHFGQPRPGNLDERIAELVRSHVATREMLYFGKEFDGWLLERIRRLRQMLVRKLHEVKNQPEEVRPIRQVLSDLLFCENLNAHSLDYLRECPSLERLTETVLRIEETLSDAVEVPVTPMGVTGIVGTAIDVRAALEQKRETRGGPDPLVQQLRGEIQALVDDLRSRGPVPAWNCPPPNPCVNSGVA
jgi:1-acyl-sn-glycerol-3-phosphate acyltransferase